MTADTEASELVERLRRYTPRDGTAAIFIPEGQDAWALAKAIREAADRITQLEQVAREASAELRLADFGYGLPDAADVAARIDALLEPRT